MNAYLRRYSILMIAVIAASGLTGCAEEGQTQVAADLVLRGGAVYTVDRHNSWAEAVAIDDGKIVYAGPVDGVQDYVGDDTRIIDLAGAMVLPGFHDIHIHAIGDQIQKRRMGLNVDSDDSTETVLEKLKAYADGNPDVPILFGAGIGTMVEKKKELLDAVDDTRPILLLDHGGHGLWVNSYALEESGITIETPNPEGGRIERDPETGEATGYIQDAARVYLQDIVTRARELTSPGPEDYVAAALEIQSQLLSFGVTSIKEPGRQEALKAYKVISDRGRLNLRVALASYFRPSDDAEENSEFYQWLGDRDAYRAEYLNPDFAKIFMDGVPGTLFMLEDYEGNNSTPRIRPDVLDAALTRLDAMGVSVMVHANGNAAVRSVLDAVENARNANGDSGIPHHSAHTALVHPDDIPRFAELNVIPENSPSLWFPNTPLDWSKKMLGNEVVESAYPARALVDAGAKYSAGSDWDNDNPFINPLPFIEALVTRKDPFGRRGDETLGIENAISLGEAIRAYTANPAHAMRHEDRLGTIEIGKAADLVILDRNLFKIPIDDISEAQVLATIFNGEIVFERTKQDWQE